MNIIFQYLLYRLVFVEQLDGCWGKTFKPHIFVFWKERATVTGHSNLKKRGREDTHQEQPWVQCFARGQLFNVPGQGRHLWLTASGLLHHSLHHWWPWGAVMSQQHIEIFNHRNKTCVKLLIKIVDAVCNKLLIECFAPSIYSLYGHRDKPELFIH